MKLVRDRRLLARLVVVASLALTSCGGGGDMAGVDSGGTGSFAVGTITGFGSVVVNGIRYDDSTAAVVDGSGAVRTAADLKLGMVVEVEGSTLAAAPAGAPYMREGKASQIRFDAEIVGPLQAVDPTTSRITVLGQTLDVTPGTIYGDELVGGLTRLAALPPGSILEIHGFLDPANGGRYAATRVDLRLGVQEYLLHGTVSQLDTTSRRFSIGAARIDYLALGVDEARAAGVVEGGLARVQLGIVPRDDGTWPMLQAASTEPPSPDRDGVDIEGLVTAFTAVTVFTVNGIPVDASHAQIDQEGGQLGLGRRVRVQGQMRAGLLIASEVELEGGGNDGAGIAPGSTWVSKPIFLSGPIGALDPAGQRLRVRGVRVNFGNSSFSGGSLADLRDGISIDVEGRLSADGATVDAVAIRFGAERIRPNNQNEPGNRGKPDDTDKPKPGTPNMPDDADKPDKPDNPNKPDKPDKPDSSNEAHSMADARSIR